MKKNAKNQKLITRREIQNAFWRKFRPRNRKKRNREPRFKACVAPEVFCIFNKHRNLVIDYLDELRQHVSTGCRHLILDLSKTKQFIAAGAILFYAEIDRLLDLHPTLKITCRNPFNKKATQVLNQIGFFKRIGKRVICSGSSHDDVVTWRVARGQAVLGEKYDLVLGKYDGVIAEALQEELYAGLTEAMTNAHHHAYISFRDDGITSPREYKPWWMFSQEKDGMLSVVFCDLGVGIPRSLPHSEDPGWQRWYTVMNRFKLLGNGDAHLISGAIRHSRTRTRKDHRGKGLTQIVETVKASEGGTAIILSNRGWYRVQEGNETYGDYRRSILGTIISWQMPIAGGA